MTSMHFYFYCLIYSKKSQKYYNVNSTGCTHNERIKSYFHDRTWGVWASLFICHIINGNTSINYYFSAEPIITCVSAALPSHGKLNCLAKSQVKQTKLCLALSQILQITKLPQLKGNSLHHHQTGETGESLACASLKTDVRAARGNLRGWRLRWKLMLNLEYEKSFLVEHILGLQVYHAF